MIWQYDILQHTEPAHIFKSHDQMTGFQSYKKLVQKLSPEFESDTTLDNQINKLYFELNDTLSQHQNL